jgi:drug/metabolite transporter (DMT)-like permease
VDVDKMSFKGGKVTGISSALTSALFLGLAPVIGKQAIEVGFSPWIVVALRTSMAAVLLLLIMLLFKPKYLYIYPAGLLGCGLAGFVNGLGSLFYYLSLKYLDASIGSLLYSLYPAFLAGWLILDRHSITKLTTIRVVIAALGVLLLTLAAPVGIHWGGVLLMLVAAIMYALHIPINQRVLLDIPAPTVTLYTLLAMSLVVVPACFLFNRQPLPMDTSWWPIFALTLVTFLSRLTLFLGVKHLGGMQTALLGLSELFVTIIVSHIWLKENLGLIQWIGALLLGISLLMIGFEKLTPEMKLPAGGWLSWLRSPDVPPNIPWGPHD